MICRKHLYLQCCCLEVPFPTVCGTFQRPQRPTNITATSPYYVKLGAPVALSWEYRQVRLPLLPSSPLSIYTLLRPAELSQTSSSFIINAIGHTNMNISFSSCNNSTNARHNIWPLNSVTIRGPHHAEHIRYWYRQWTGLQCIQLEHQLHHCGRTGSGQPHGTEKDRSLGGTMRGLNAVPSNRRSMNGNSHRRNGVMDAREEMFVLFYPMQFSLALRRTSCLSGLTITFLLSLFRRV